MEQQVTQEKQINKVRRYLHQGLKYGIVIALVVFAVFSITHRELFSEYTAKIVPAGEELTYISLSGNDRIEQKFKATADNIERLDFRIENHYQSVREGKLSISIVDSKGNTIYEIRRKLATVDGTRKASGKLGKGNRNETKWFHFMVNQEIEKGETYTYVFQATGIPKDTPLRLCTDNNMGSVYEKITLNGTPHDERLRVKLWTTQIDMWALGLTLAIIIGLIVVILVPFKFDEKWNKRFTWALFVVNPFVAFYMVEKIFYNPVSRMEPMAFALNILWFYILFGVLLMIFNRVKYSLLVGNIFLYGAAIANYFVLSFRGNPITPADVFAMGTAMDVADHYVLTYDKPAMVATVVLFALCVGACKLDTVKAMKRKSRIIAVVITAVVTVGSYALLHQVELLKKANVEVNFFSQVKGYRSNGYVLSFLMNLQYTLATEPEGYKVDKVKEIAKDYTIETGKNTKLKQKPNVIAVMNETLSDLNVVNKIETNKEVFPYLNSLKENTIKGKMLVSVFGGGTSNSEYEFLTGNSVATLPLNGNAYTQFVKHEVPTLATQLKEQGYDTVAFHPYKPEAWNRQSVYPLIGFDKFLDMSVMDENARKIRGWYSDEADYDKIIETYENKDKDKPLFMFNVTIQNHGGYTTPDQVFDEEIQITDEKKNDLAKRYLSLMHESDRAFKKLVEYFEKQDEPTIIVMFGDHQPKLGDDFYELLYGKSLTGLSLEDMQKQYTVPFYIWANYDIEDKEYEDKISANYLSSIMLEQTNLKMTRYNQFLLDVQKEVPAVNANGYVGADGKDYSWEDKTKYSDLLSKYQFLQYNCLNDKKNTYMDLFSVKE